MEKIRILLVEDNPGDARLIRETLWEVNPEGFELQHADRLATAAEILATGELDVILLDLSLPDARGMETVERTLALAPDAAIVVLTGLDDSTVAVQALQAGAQDYLVKGQPDPELLARAIRYAMERKRLERERRRLLRSEQEARAQAESAVRGRDEVLRVVSHDLGNSLSAVGIHATLLERARKDAAPDDEVRRRAVAIRQLVKQMHDLRQDLLDAASIEAGRLSMFPVRERVETVVADVADALHQIADEKGIVLVVDLPGSLPDVFADRQRLQQVLNNLLGNALKFTPAGGSITLRARERDGCVCLSVIDTGPGIEKEDLSNIFERFWKGGRDDRKGAGLGLTIARGIVEGHGGQIWAESTPGEGSSFHFTIPVHGADVVAGRPAL
jgi:signal transduction histidine kinase